jgi:hypothetical protein
MFGLKIINSIEYKMANTLDGKWFRFQHEVYES